MHSLLEVHWCLFLSYRQRGNGSGWETTRDSIGRPPWTVKWNRWQLIDTVNHMVAVWLCNVTSVLQRWTDEVSECGLFF
jgi:hypothetical protein